MEVLPARQGDAILVEYGADEAAAHRILVDGGTPGTKADLRARLLELGTPPIRFELLVITHVDGDHIGGVLELLENDPGIATFDDVWFNAWRHLPANEVEPLGPVQGERLTTWLDRHGTPWNLAFDARAVAVPDEGDLPTIALPEGMRATVLSPGTSELAALRPVWEREVREAGLEPGTPYTEAAEIPATVAALGPPPTPEDVERWAATPSSEDGSEANGASISMLLELEGRSALLTGDAHSAPLVRGVDRLLGVRGAERLEVGVFKLPHHGSRRNVSTELIGRVRADAYVFSTNGALYGHPDLEAVARVALAADDARLCFNYDDRAGIWREPGLVDELGYILETPTEGPLRVDV
ncbi:MAG TPA: MBL fold metallo-hydrolase [Actinomycetota bacterium]|nr:MBL fold metallo-hydrolase [Actinomycetota bacterium]